MSRRRTKYFANWATGVVAAVIAALILYQLRIHKAEYRLEHNLSRFEQQLQHNLTPQPPVVHQPSPAEVSARQEAARRQAEIDRRRAAEFAKATAEERRKEDAWLKYFTPTDRCQIPDSEQMIQVCQANEAKNRARFEVDWAAGRYI